jgi:hypothetical protein
MYGALRVEGGMPGPCVTQWDSVSIGDVAGASSEASKKRIRAHVMQVASSTQPVEVDPSGTKVVIAADDGDGHCVTCEDFDGPLDFDLAAPAPSIDKFDIDAGSGSNTVVYNDFKDVAQRLAGPLSLDYLQVTLPIRACTTHRMCPYALLSFYLPFHRNLHLLHFDLLHDFFYFPLLSNPFTLTTPRHESLFFRRNTTQALWDGTRACAVARQKT